MLDRYKVINSLVLFCDATTRYYLGDFVVFFPCVSVWVIQLMINAHRPLAAGATLRYNCVQSECFKFY